MQAGLEQRSGRQPIPQNSSFLDGNTKWPEHPSDIPVLLCLPMPGLRMKLFANELKIPQQFDEHMHAFVRSFPDNVRYDKDTRSAEIIAPMSFELRVTLSYVAFVSEFCDVTDNLEIVLSDMKSLADSPPHNPKEGERRYFLLTRLFFYELLRIKDAFPRFLKRMEQDGLMTRQQRLSSKKLIEDQMQEHYLIRNTYLHGHTMPKNDHEFDLSLMNSAVELGYQPVLTPLDGSETKTYPEFLTQLASKRYDLLLSLANDYVALFQAILDTTAAWVSDNRFAVSQADT